MIASLNARERDWSGLRLRPFVMKPSSALDDASHPPRNGKRREPLSDALLLAAESGVILDTIVPQLRARVSPSGVVSFQVAYWSRSAGAAKTFTIGRWAPAVGGRRAGVSVPDARRVAADVLARARIGQDPQAERVAARQRELEEQPGITLRELAGTVLGRLERRPATLRGYRQALDSADEITEALTQWLGEEALESDRVEAEAVREAAACCGGSDCGWREAGYASAVAAAEVLVDVPRSDPRLRSRTLELVAAHLERMEARR